MCRGCCAWPVGADLTFGHVRSRWLTITMSLMIIVSYYSATVFFASSSGYCGGVNGGCGTWAILLQVLVIAATEFVNWFSSQVNNPLRNKVYWAGFGALVIVVQAGILIFGMTYLAGTLVDFDEQEITEEYTNYSFYYSALAPIYNQSVTFASPVVSSPPPKQLPIFFLSAYICVVGVGGLMTLYFLFRLCCFKQPQDYYFVKRQKHQEAVLQGLANLASSNKIAEAEQTVVESWRRYLLCLDEDSRYSCARGLLDKLATHDISKPYLKPFISTANLQTVIASIESAKDTNNRASPLKEENENEVEDEEEEKTALCLSPLRIELETKTSSLELPDTPQVDYILHRTPSHVYRGLTSPADISPVASDSHMLMLSPNMRSEESTIVTENEKERPTDNERETEQKVIIHPPPPPPSVPPRFEPSSGSSPLSSQPHHHRPPVFARHVSQMIVGLAESIDIDNKSEEPLSSALPPPPPTSLQNPALFSPSIHSSSTRKLHGTMNVIRGYCDQTSAAMSHVFDILPHPRLPEDIVRWQAERAKNDQTNKAFGAIEIPSFVWISVIATLGFTVMLLGSAWDLIYVMETWLTWALTLTTHVSREVCQGVTSIPPVDPEWRSQLELFNATIPQDAATEFLHRHVDLLVSLGETAQFAQTMSNNYCSGELKFNLQRFFNTHFSFSTEFTVSQVEEFIRRSLSLWMRCAKAAAVIAWFIVALSTYYLTHGFRRVRGLLRVGLESRIPLWKPEIYKVSHAPLLMGMAFSTALWGFWLSFFILSAVFFFCLSDVTWGIILNEAVWKAIVQFALVFAFKKVMEIICGTWISDGYTIRQPVLWSFYMSTMFAFGFITGFVSALLRLIFLAIISGLAIFRLDVTVFPSSVCNMDLAWVSFMASVCLDHRHTNRAYLEKIETFIRKRTKSP